MDNFGVETIYIYIYIFGLLLLLAFSGLYCLYDNVCYVKSEFQKQRMISYYTTLITRIKSAERYQDELPVVYINPGKIEDSTLRDIPAFREVRLEGSLYGGAKRGINGAWRAFMNHWCGFSPIEGDPEKYEHLPEVQAMPRYPDAGSIRVINGAVVVKF